MTVVVVKPPLQYEAVCSHCTATLQYAGSDLEMLPNGSRRGYKMSLWGVKCPVCRSNVSHEAAKVIAQ
jgi:hypothetical protein